jgi:hypothetical protein
LCDFIYRGPPKGIDPSLFPPGRSPPPGVPSLTVPLDWTGRRVDDEVTLWCRRGSEGCRSARISSRWTKGTVSQRVPEPRGAEPGDSADVDGLFNHLRIFHHLLRRDGAARVVMPVGGTAPGRNLDWTSVPEPGSAETDDWRSRSSHGGSRARSEL